MVVFDKAEIKEYLSLENLYDLLVEWGGEPEYTSFGLISSTICHNMPGQGSRKLYYYENSGLFHCYTGCEEPNFDIFQLCIKINSIQNHLSFDLNDAVRWVAQRFGISGVYQQDDDKKVLDDWKYFENYERIQDIELKTHDVILKEYESDILDRFNFDVKLTPWFNEGINLEVLEHARIGFYPGGDQITIPHFDKDGRFIGLRGRTLCEEEGELFGK